MARTWRSLCKVSKLESGWISDTNSTSREDINYPRSTIFLSIRRSSLGLWRRSSAPCFRDEVWETEFAISGWRGGSGTFWPRQMFRDRKARLGHKLRVITRSLHWSWGGKILGVTTGFYVVQTVCVLIRLNWLQSGYAWNATLTLKFQNVPPKMQL